MERRHYVKIGPLVQPVRVTEAKKERREKATSALANWLFA